MSNLTWTPLRQIAIVLPLRIGDPTEKDFTIVPVKKKNGGWLKMCPYRCGWYLTLEPGSHACRSEVCR